MRPLCSVVLSTYQRGHLLARSLVSYAKQDFDNDRFELVVIDDHSSDQTRDMVLDWSRATGIRAVVLTPSPKPAQWQDCGAILNYGIRASHGEHVLLTHPEVMVGRQSVRWCVDRLAGFERVRKMDQPDWGCPVGLYACCKVYYLSPREQQLLDTCNWVDDGALAVRHIHRFYEDDTNGLPDYSHRATDLVATPGYRHPSWESWVFGGCSRETWKRLGGMLETSQWGSVDIAFTHRRRTLGIPNHTCSAEDTIVVHQNHDSASDVITDRSMDKWVEELKDYPLNDPSKLVWPAVDNL